MNAAMRVLDLFFGASGISQGDAVAVCICRQTLREAQGPQTAAFRAVPPGQGYSAFRQDEALQHGFVLVAGRQRQTSAADARRFPGVGARAATIPGLQPTKWVAVPMSRFCRLCPKRPRSSMCVTSWSGFGEHPINRIDQLLPWASPQGCRTPTKT